MKITPASVGTVAALVAAAVVAAIGALSSSPSKAAESEVALSDFGSRNEGSVLSRADLMGLRSDLNALKTELNHRLDGIDSRLGRLEGYNAGREAARDGR